MTGLAGHVGEIFCQFLARPLAFGLAEAAVEIGDDALERLLGVVGAHAVFVGELDLVLAGAVQDRGLRLLRQVLPLGVERELVELAERGQRLDVIGRRRFRPGRDRALAQRRFLVGNDEVLVDMLLDAEAAAGGTRAIGVVEREQPRLDFRNGEAGDRAGELFRKQNPFWAALIVDFCGFLLFPGSVVQALGRARRRIGDIRSPQGLRRFQRGLETFCEALADIGRTTMRSTTTSMSCGNFLSSVGASASSWNLPSILTR